ncbi:MAG: type II toxin-antitoxin system RelE/ParE family toxin [Bacteroidetes bacterium]|nr:type II toxin-antitoxin system RelE/ParE family toxin [Bacteroidota bacterium]
MAKTVKWNKQALQTFHDTATYLEENFSRQAALNFVNDIFEKVEAVRKYPTIGRKAPKRKTVRFILVGKHRRLYYRLEGKYLVISSIFDTRQHPDKDVHQ